MPNPLLVVWQDLFCLILTSKSLSTLSVWTSATQSVVPGPEVSLGKLWEMQIWGPCPRPTDSEFLGILWLNKPSLLKFENYWRKSYLKGTWVDSSGQAAWLCIAIVKFSKVGMLLSSHPKEKSMDTNVDWKHTKSLQVMVPARKRIEKNMHSENLIPKKNPFINMNLQISQPMPCQCYRHFLRPLQQL